MRQIGSLSHQTEAERFTAYLITQGVAAHAEEDDGAWTVWVRDEDKLDHATEALKDFRRHPDDQRYQGVIREASARLAAEARRHERVRRNIVTMGERWRHQRAGSTPLVSTVIGLCVVVFFITNFGDAHPRRRTTAYETLAFANPLHEERNPDWDARDPRDRAIDIRRGEVWRLVTPAFMHGSPMHLAFNMIMFYIFGSQIERRRGPWRLLLLILLTGALSNAAQGLAPSDWGTLAGTHRFLGLSGVVYGLLGYLWMKTLYEPASGLYVSGGTVAFLVVWMLLGFTGTLGLVGLHIANLAHGVGMLTGMVAGYLPLLMRR
jgi:GlpG protein